MCFTPYRLFSLLQGAGKVLRYLSRPPSWNQSFQRLLPSGRFTKESYHRANILSWCNIVYIVYKLNCPGHAIRYGETLDTINHPSFSPMSIEPEFNNGGRSPGFTYPSQLPPGQYDVAVIYIFPFKYSLGNNRFHHEARAPVQERARVGHSFFLESMG